MGIRVDSDELRLQLELSSQQHFAELTYHRQILDGSVPSAIGGGLGLERIYMLLLGKAHIGEVSCTPWPQVMYEVCDEFNIPLIR